jgi:hypothetical protein
LRKSNLVSDSIRSYLDNITNVSVNTIINSDLNNDNYVNNSETEQDDETSIQETLTIKNKSDGKLLFILKHKSGLYKY